MNKIWIGNGQLVLPDKIVPGGSVLLEGKKIAAVNVPCPPDARRVDVDGSYIMAGGHRQKPAEPGSAAPENQTDGGVER